MILFRFRIVWKVSVWKKELYSLYYTKKNPLHCSSFYMSSAAVNVTDDNSLYCYCLFEFKCVSTYLLLLHVRQVGRRPSPPSTGRHWLLSEAFLKINSQFKTKRWSCIPLNFLFDWNWWKENVLCLWCIANTCLTSPLKPLLLSHSHTLTSSYVRGVIRLDGWFFS